MSSERSRNTRLGLFVVTGVALLIVAFYLIGSKQNLFGSTFRISTTFHDVGGLMKGNNVRFAGIDVGTIESVRIESDTVVRVTMVIEDRIKPFIKKNAVASVGTDGLMGNRLVNLSPTGVPAKGIEEGDELRSRHPLEMDQMMRTLNVTNENIRAITDNLRSVTERINSRNSLMSLLLDTIIADKIKATAVDLKRISGDGIAISGNLRGLSEGLMSGKTSIGALLKDTVIFRRIDLASVKLQSISDTAAVLTGDLSDISRRLRHGKGSIGVLLRDSTFAINLNRGAVHIDSAAVNFNENMEALQHTWPFKRYFRKPKR
jgi:phospholipid/cholesterol/gamma-HCH transport system substrate-binding protein